MISVTDNSPTHNEYSNETEENSTPSGDMRNKSKELEFTEVGADMTTGMDDKMFTGVDTEETQMHGLTVTEMIAAQIDVEPKLVKNTLMT